MPDRFYKFTGKIDRRGPRNEGDFNDPIERINLLSRNGRLTRPRGTVKINSTGLTGIPKMNARYYSGESGVISPKSFVYTDAGYLYLVDDISGVATEIMTTMNKNAHPKYQLVKTGGQYEMYIVDGKDLYVYDGNNDNEFLKVSPTDQDGNSINPIDIMEFMDRLWIISLTDLYISANLEFRVFDSATDSFNGVIGSGLGKNLRFAKLFDTPYIFNTEGIFGIIGDTISTLAAGWEVRRVTASTCSAAGSVCQVENGILYLGTDFELHSFGGTAPSDQILTWNEKLSDFINPYPSKLEEASSVYHDKYYKLSFVLTGENVPRMEVWYDAVEQKCEFVKGRNVSCYMKTDPTQEVERLDIGKSNEGYILHSDWGRNFDNEAIEVRLRTKDITIAKGKEVRFTDFYPEIEPISPRTMIIRYLLNGQLSEDTGANTAFELALSGLNKGVGLLAIINQSQVLKRYQPKINYSRGESVAFEIFDKTIDKEFTMLGIGFNFTKKED